MTTTRTWLTVAEVADEFGMSVSTVHVMIKDGRLQAYRPSGSPRGMYRVPQAEVVRLQIETGQITPAAA